MPSQSPASVGTAFYSQGDTAPALRRRLLEGSTPIDLTNATSVTITISYARYSHYYSPFEKKVDRYACNIEAPATDGWVNYVPLSTHLDIVGEYHYIFEINWNDGTRQTVPAHTYETLIVRAKPGGVE